MMRLTGSERQRQKGKSWLAQLESDERERTGIKNLRIKYNKVFGYYIEVLNSFKGNVPGGLCKKADSHQC